jgi:hypothetical protein
LIIVFFIVISICGFNFKCSDWKWIYQGNILYITILNSIYLNYFLKNNYLLNKLKIR